MGTHISKVKSIDLDIWQPEQMEVSTSFQIRPTAFDVHELLIT
jgi:hypothetical protein